MVTIGEYYLSVGHFHGSMIYSATYDSGGCSQDNLSVKKVPFYSFIFFFRPLQMEYAGMARYPQMYGSMDVQQQSPREKAVMVRDSFQSNVI